MGSRITYESDFVLAVRLLHNIGRIMLTIVFTLSIGQVYGSAKEASYSTVYENGGIIVIDAGSGSVVITNGRITATEGNSVKLMPGTHIKEGSEMVVNIVSIEHQEALAKKAAEERREKSRSYIVKHQPPPPLLTEVVFTIRYQHGIPGNRTSLSQQRPGGALLLVQIQSIPNLTKFSLLTSSYQPPKNLIYSTFLNPHSPILSWGKRPETIGIMRT